MLVLRLSIRGDVLQNVPVVGRMVCNVLGTGLIAGCVLC